MKIIMIGTGYVGLVSGACFADLGHDVTCVDIDDNKINLLKQGRVPFHEPGLDELILKNVAAGRLHFSTLLAQAMPQAKIIMICVGTPPKPDGQANLNHVFQAAKEIADNLKQYTVIVDKSTVPVGTGKKVRKIISRVYQGEFDVVSCPEFLREGSAIEDFTNPDRIVIGADSERAKNVMFELFKDVNCPKLVTNIETAEMIKYASNAFLACKISFINEIANVCENVDADVTQVAAGMGYDKRIGRHFLNAGIGYGGSCFPKDVRALHYIAGAEGYSFQLLRAIIEVNNHQRWKFFRKVKNELHDIHGKTIAIWGLAFKPNTDDIRESIALDLIPRLLDEDVKAIQAFDPKAAPLAKQKIPEIHCAATPLQAAAGADCLLIFTEWPEFKQINLEELKKTMRQPLIFDGRNIFEPAQMKNSGFIYHSIGRTAPHQ